jgi:uncharacterized protein (DUF2252 family)
MGTRAVASPKAIPVQAPSETAARAAAGSEARRRRPRSTQGEWRPPSDRRDPVAILEEQATSRLADLVPIRHGRMAASPFAFYRGGAAIMAADLAADPSSGLIVQLCGDAHLVNFGGYDSPERELVFDLNDFDETLPGPFEWDVKRLVASIEVAGRARSFTPAQRNTILTGTAHAYRLGLREFADKGNLDIWYTRMSGDQMAARWGGDIGPKELSNLKQTVAKAGRKNHLKAMAKLTQVVDGRLQFVADPPLLVPVVDLVEELVPEDVERFVADAVGAYRDTLSDDRRRLVDRYRFVDLARKVVGVGSVGTRCWVALFVGRDHDDPLFLQIKEAQTSVLEPYAGVSVFDQQGQRVVAGQRFMQAVSDILLGWMRITGIDGEVRDFYIRQLWDAKASADIETMTLNGMTVYGQICGWTLARGHARSGDPIALGAYLGGGDGFDRAVCSYARAYADQNEADHRAFVAAIDAGRVTAESGI